MLCSPECNEDMQGEIKMRNMGPEAQPIGVGTGVGWGGGEHRNYPDQQPTIAMNLDLVPHHMYFRMDSNITSPCVLYYCCWLRM